MLDEIGLARAVSPPVFQQIATALSPGVKLRRNLNHALLSFLGMRNYPIAGRSGEADEGNSTSSSTAFDESSQRDYKVANRSRPIFQR